MIVSHPPYPLYIYYKGLSVLRLYQLFYIVSIHTNIYRYCGTRRVKYWGSAVLAYIALLVHMDIREECVQSWQYAHIHCTYVYTIQSVVGAEMVSNFLHTTYPYHNAPSPGIPTAPYLGWHVLYPLHCWYTRLFIWQGDECPRIQCINTRHIFKIWDDINLPTHHLSTTKCTSILFSKQPKIRAQPSQ